mgnify:CR=1 FL=1
MELNGIFPDIETSIPYAVLKIVLLNQGEPFLQSNPGTPVGGISYSKLLYKMVQDFLDIQ